MSYIIDDLKDKKNVRSVVVSYYSVQKKEKKNWFSTETYLEEVKTSAEKYVLNEGVVIKREHLKFSNDGVHRTIYEYRNGLETKSTQTNPDGSVRVKTSIYDKNNRIIQDYVYLNNSFENGNVYKYDERGNCIENEYSYCCSSSYHEMKFQYRWEYSYSAYGTIETQINMNDGSRKEYQYDYMKRLKKVINYDNAIIKSSREYIYNLQGKAYKWIVDGRYTEEEHFDEHGNSLWYKWYRKNGNEMTEIISTYEYVYDSKGNWTELRQYRNGEYNLLQIREIEYINN